MNIKCLSIKEVRKMYPHLNFNIYPRWISVKDKLPDTDQYVLTYKNGAKCIRINWYSTSSKRWMMESNIDYRDITHWMELPSSPEPPEDK